MALLRNRPWLVLLFLFALIHGAFLAGDLSHPDRFLQGDRAENRLLKMAALAHAPPGGLAQTLVAQGPPGDYVMHDAAMQLGGRGGVLAVQLLLQLSLVLGAYFLVLRLDRRPAVAFCAGLLTLLLPGGLMSPHMLASETWSAAFLGYAAALLCLAPSIDGDPKGARRRLYIVTGFLMVGVAAFVRPQAIATPLALWVVLPWLGYARWPVRTGAILAMLIFPVSWMLFNLAVTGHFTLGQNDADFGINLALRAQRVTTMAAHLPPPTGDGSRIGLGDFFAVVKAHPVETLRTYITDAVNVFFNPGANHLFGRYLHLFEFKGVWYWRDVNDRGGPLGVVKAIFGEGGLFLGFFMLAALLHLAMLVGALITLVLSLIRRAQVPAWPKVMLVIIVANLVVAFAAGSLRWAHRAPIEPLLACVAVYGLARMVGFARQRRART